MTRSKKASEVRILRVDFRPKLGSGELLSGTPTVVELTTTDLTISDIELTVSHLLPVGMVFIPTSQGVQFLVSGGTAGVEYTIRVTAETDDGQTLIEEVVLRVN